METNYESMTVAELKDFAKSRDIKIASGLKKAEIIQFIKASLIEQASGVTKKVDIKLDLSTLVPMYANLTSFQGQPYPDWLYHLHQHGWSVTPIPDFNSAKYVDAFYSWLESCGTNFNRLDAATWEGKNIPSTFHGIIRNYIGHEDWIWEIRQKCKSIFSTIWQTEDLLCSFDGGCFLPPKPNVTAFKEWFHCDQGHFCYDFACVQGVVNLIDNGKDDGGLVLLQNSKNYFKSYLNRHPSEGIKYCHVDVNDDEMKGLTKIKICAPAGHILLWDSRMVHCNVAPTGSKPRMCTYVSMAPRSGASADVISKRIKAYEEGRMTNHWAYGPWMMVQAAELRSFGVYTAKPTEIKIAQLNDVQRSLVGY